MKFFVLDPKSHVGRSVVKKLTETGHELVTPDEKKPMELGTLVTSADIVVLDLSNNADKNTAIITHLKNEELKEDMILIGVSTVMTWSKTTKSSAKPLGEANYRSRKTSPKYKGTRVLETLVMSAQKDNLFSYVIAAGILYGDGEDEFHHLFKSAWLCEEEGLPILGSGDNVIPTLHVADLATIVQHVMEAPPADHQYIVAVDQSTSTQKSIVQAVSTGLGIGKVYHVDLADPSIVLGQRGNAEVLLLDMKFEMDYLPNIELPWRAQTGIEPVFDAVRLEFVAQRRLRPVRVMMHGPPGSGKSHYAERIAREYYLPHIKIADVIKETLAKDDAFAEQVAASLSDSAAEMKGKRAAARTSGSGTTTAASSGGAAAKASPRGTTPPKPGAKKSKDTRARIPVELLTKMVKMKLRTPQCRNKGFVLDGYPRTLDESKALFGPDPPERDPDDPEGDLPEVKEPVEPQLDENGNELPPPEPPKDPTTLVEFVVMFECTDRAAADRFKALGEAHIVVGHNDVEGFSRRWKAYVANNDPDADPAVSPLSFLPKVEVLELPQSISNDDKQGIEAISTYLNKKGKAANYHPTPEEEAARKSAIETKAREEKEAIDRDQAHKEQKEFEERVTREHALKVREAQVKLEEQALVDACSQPLRKYLMLNVIPALVDGLVQVCKQQPDDPIDYLAEFLFKYSVGGALEEAAAKQERKT